ncbi:MAG: glutathione S-transferase family protein [Gaiellaceae bacterium]
MLTLDELPAAPPAPARGSCSTLPESAVTMEYLQERHPEPPLLPPDASERSFARVLIFRFDELAHPHDALGPGEAGARERLDRAVAQLDAELVAQPYLTGRKYGLADIAYAPWLLRARSSLGSHERRSRRSAELGRRGALTDWLDRLLERPAVAAESELVSAR